MESNLELKVNYRNQEHTFHISIERISEDTDIWYVGNPAKGHSSCMLITVDSGLKIGELQGLSYHKDCSLGSDLESHIGTIVMVQGVLKYLVSYYSFLKSIDIVDTASKWLPHARKNIEITPRRFLLGKKGWYQEHFGAVPSPKTRAVKKLIRRAAPVQDTENWGTREEIIEELKKHGFNPEIYASQLFSTLWKIPIKTVATYPVTVSARILTVGGGGRVKKNRDRIAKLAMEGRMRYIDFLKNLRR